MRHQIMSITNKTSFPANNFMIVNLNRKTKFLDLLTQTHETLYKIKKSQKRQDECQENFWSPHEVFHNMKRNEGWQNNLSNGIRYIISL